MRENQNGKLASKIVENQIERKQGFWGGNTF